MRYITYWWEEMKLKIQRAIASSSPNSGFPAATILRWAIMFTWPGQGGRDTSRGGRWWQQRAKRFGLACPCSSATRWTCIQWNISKSFKKNYGVCHIEESESDNGCLDKSIVERESGEYLKVKMFTLKGEDRQHQHGRRDKPGEGRCNLKV